MNNEYDIDDLRSKLKDYYGTAATVMGHGNPFGFMPALAEMINVDRLSDDEVIEEAEKLGIIYEVTN